MARIVLPAAMASLALIAPSSTLGASAPRVHTIVIDKMKFGALPANIHAGDTIVWVNRDMFQHTATARDKSFDVKLPAGKSAKMVVERSGAIPFHCVFHPGMKGALKVAAR
jgi:plastocyanin